MDPTKKELYTAKRPSGLDVSSAEVKTLIDKLRSDVDNTNWLVLKISGSAELVIHSSGETGFDGLYSSLNDDDIFYGAIKCSVNGKIKFYHIYFVGENVGGMKKGKACLYKPSVFGLIDAHGEITASTGLSEFSRDTFLSGVAKLSNVPVGDIVI